MSGQSGARRFCGGKPAWLNAAYASVGIPSCALHFDQGFAWDGVKQVPFNAMAACARSTEETTLLPSSPAGKSYIVIPANTLAIDPGNGCQIFQASTGNSFALPMAPATQTITLIAGTYTLWVNGLTYCDIAAGTATGTGWGRCATGSPVTVVITVGGTVTCTVGIAGQLMASQLEPGAFGTPFMRVAGIPRNADVVTLVGAAQTAALNAKSAFFRTNGVAGGTAPRLLDGATSKNKIYYSSTTQVTISPNFNPALAATLGGSTTFAALTNSSFGFDANGLSAKANGGTRTTNATVLDADTFTYLASRSAGDRALNGYMLRAAFGPTKGMFDNLAVAP